MKKKYFDLEYLKQIKFICLVMSSRYIEQHFDHIKKYANVIERRLEDNDCEKGILLRDNRITLEKCKKYGCDYILIDDEYKVDISFVDIEGGLYE